MSRMDIIFLHVHISKGNSMCLYDVYVLTIILLITTIVALNLFNWSTKPLLLGMECLSKHQDLQIFVLKLNKK